MRATYVLLILVKTHARWGDGITAAEESVEVENQPSGFASTLVGNGIVSRHRDLKGSETMIDAYDGTKEERGLVDRIRNLFKSSPVFGKQAERLRKDRRVAESQQNNSVSDRLIKNVRAYFGRLKATSSPVERFFIYATIVLSLAGAWVILSM